MRENLDPRDAAREPLAEPRAVTPTDAIASDREVTPPRTELPPAVHAFLDGDKVAETQLSAAERELELWKRISAETGRRRRMVTPAYLPKQILSKLADD